MLPRSTSLLLAPLLSACALGSTPAQAPSEPPAEAAATARIEAFHEARTSLDQPGVERYCDESYGRCPVDFRGDTWDVAAQPVEIRCSFTTPVPTGYRVVVVEASLASGERVVGQVRTRRTRDGQVVLGDDYADGPLLTRMTVEGGQVSFSWRGANPTLPGHEADQRRIEESCEDPEGFLDEVLVRGPSEGSTAVHTEPEG